MSYLPIFMNLGGRRCLVAGGGEVGERRVAALLDAGAIVRVVSPDVTDELDRLAKSGAIEHRSRRWQSGDLEGCALAFAATDDPELNRAIAAEARSLKIPVNVADEPGLCDFIMPSVVGRGDLRIAVSTSGASPAFASRVRRDLENLVGPEYEVAVQILRAARIHLRAHERDALERARILQSLAFSDIVDLIRDANWAGVDRMLTESLGVGLDGLAIASHNLLRIA